MGLLEIAAVESFPEAEETNKEDFLVNVVVVDVGCDLSRD